MEEQINTVSTNNNNVSTPIEEPWRMLEKVPAGDGCVEDPDVAFHLFCGIKPIQFGLYGFHNTPHLGCYSDDYNPFLPILSISQKFSNILIPDSIIQILAKVAEHGLLDDSSIKSLDDSIDVFAFIHAGFKGQKCHHLYCDRTDEFNIMYHPWVFTNDADYVSSGGELFTSRFYCSLYESEGIIPCHEYQGGMTFNELKRQPVVAHGTRFSPNVMNIRLEHVNDYLEKITKEKMEMKKKISIETTKTNTSISAESSTESSSSSSSSSLLPPPSPPLPPPPSSSSSLPPSASDPSSFATFYSVAIDGDLKRAVIVLHCLPLGDDAADKVRELLKGESKLGKVVDKLGSLLPTFIKGIKNFFTN